MKYIWIIACLALATSAFADTTQSRDGQGQKMQGGSFGVMKTYTSVTKGFKCWSTANSISWEIKAVPGNSTTAASVGFKMFYNGNESVVYPISDKFFQWNNSPTQGNPTLTSVCQRAYSTGNNNRTKFYGVFQ